MGEIFFNLIDREGTLNGYDKFFVEEIIKDTFSPLIYSGGISSKQEIETLICDYNLSVGVGAFFVLYGRRRSVLIQYLDYEELILIRDKYINKNV